MIIGNEKQQEFLKELVENFDKGTILVYGPEGVGKFSFLKNFLRTKNYELISIENDEKIYKIETARLLTSLSQRESKKRIILINDAHKFQRESQNTLLKTLEESPSKIIFILITHRFSKIIPTIRSRSILVRFNLVAKEKIQKFLEEKGYKLEEIKKALKYYPYQPGKAIKILENKEKLDLFEKFIVADLNQKINLIEEIKKNFTLQEFLEIYLIHLQNSKGKPSFIKKILDLYFDSDYNLNFEMQLINLILNYG